jgi:hypothetical protein
MSAAAADSTAACLASSDTPPCCWQRTTTAARALRVAVILDAWKAEHLFIIAVCILTGWR